MGSAKAPGSWRSKKFSRLIAKRMNSAYQARDPVLVMTCLEGILYAPFATAATGTRTSSELDPGRDPECSRSPQERIDLPVLVGSVEGDLIVVLVGKIRRPKLDRPFIVGCSEPQARIHDSI